MKSVEEEWGLFKTGILQAAKETCEANKKESTEMKITKWLNEQLKEANMRREKYK